MAKYVKRSIIIITNKISLLIDLSNLSIINPMKNPHQIFTVLLPILTLSFAQFINPFSSSPFINTRMSLLSTSSYVKISPDQSIVAVGFQNGTVNAYNILGGYMYQFTGGISNAIQQLGWVPNVGLISIDNSGNLNLWAQNGNIIVSKTLGSGYTQFTITTSALGLGYIAVGSSSSINEYLVTGLGFLSIQTYLPPSGMSFQGPILYSPGYSVLFACASANSNVQSLYSYSCSTATTNTGMAYQITGGIPQAMSQFTPGSYLLLVSNSGSGSVYSFTNSVPISANYLGSSGGTYLFTTCSGGPYIVTGFSQQISVWSSAMNNIQTLNYAVGTLNSIDCSGGYLVSVDSSNYLAVNSYFGNSSIDINTLVTLAGWVIGIIIGISVAIVAGIVGCIICCCRRRNKATQLMLNNTVQKELIISTPTNQYSPQPNYNGQFNGPAGQGPFQTNTYGNPQQNVYVQQPNPNQRI